MHIRTYASMYLFILCVLIANYVCWYVLSSFTAIITSIRQSIFDIITKRHIQLALNCPKDFIFVACTVYRFCLAKIPVGLWCIQNEKKLVKSYT
jgi:hypothetical protein